MKFGVGVCLTKRKTEVRRQTIYFEGILKYVTTGVTGNDKRSYMPTFVLERTIIYSNGHRKH